MPSFNCQIDPHSVLGVGQGASLQEIREAYRARAERYHPDAGGEEWTFRILVQSYEILSKSRVAEAVRTEAGPWTEKRRAPRDIFETQRAAPTGERADPSRVVGLEKLWVRYESDSIWLLQEAGRGDRFLSCSLNISWPNADFVGPVDEIPDLENRLKQLSDVFEEMSVTTRVVSGRARIESQRFSGWLSYPTVERACSAARLLCGLLNGNGFDVKQWSRDLLIPVDWK